MQVLENVFEDMTEFDRLERAYRNARKQKRYRDETLRFSSDLDKNLLNIQRAVREGSFRFGPYQRRWIHVPKKRLIMALPFPSRIVQWTVYEELNSFYDKMMIEDSYACRKHKGSLAAALRLQYWMRQADSKPGDWYYVKLDISKFFYRVDHKVLLDILGRRIKDAQLMELLRIIIESDGEHFGLPRFMGPEDVETEEWLGDVGMPIGNLTSQLFANIYLNELDQYCKHVLHIEKYVRYMDDVILIVPSKELAQQYKAAIEKFLNEKLHLDLNDKTAVRPLGRIEFVGYIVTTHDLKLRKQTARRIKSAFRGICSRYFDGEMSKQQFERRVASYGGMIQHCEAAQLRTRLNQIYVYAAEKRGIKAAETSLPFAA